MQLDLKTWLEIASLGGTLLVGGVKYGMIDNRVSALELRKDQTEDVSSVKAQVSDIKNDLADVKSDVRDIKHYIFNHPAPRK